MMMNPVRPLQDSNGIYGVMVKVEITRFSVKKLRFGGLTG